MSKRTCEKEHFGPRQLLQVLSFSFIRRTQDKTKKKGEKINGESKKARNKNVLEDVHQYLSVSKGCGNGTSLTFLSKRSAIL